MERDARTARECARLNGSGRYWEHLLSWWPRRDADDVLFLAFEDVIADLAGTVGRVARVIGAPSEPGRLAVATRQAHIDFMRAHGSRFGDHLVREARRAACGLPAGAHTTKVREGRAGGHRDVLDAPLVAALDAEWRAVIEPATGHASYAALGQG